MGRMLALIIVLWGCSQSSLVAQFGLRIMATQNHLPELERLFSEQPVQVPDLDFVGNGLEANLDYWFRLKDYRVEFFPYLGFTSFSGQGANPNELLEYDMNQIGAGVHVHLYPFDLVGDCDCPTFSKQSGVFERGFFLLGGLGMEATMVGGQTQTGISISDRRSFDPVVRLGIGFDLGLSDLWTISPVFQYSYLPFLSASHIAMPNETTSTTTALGRLQLGLRIGIRADYRS